MQNNGNMSNMMEAFGFIFNSPKKHKGGRRWVGVVSGLLSEPLWSKLQDLPHRSTAQGPDKLTGAKQSLHRQQCWSPRMAGLQEIYARYIDLKKRGQTGMLYWLAPRQTTLEGHHVLTRNCDARKETCIGYGSTYHLGNRHTGPVTRLVGCSCAYGTAYSLLWGSPSLLILSECLLNSTAGRSLFSALCVGEGPHLQLLSYCGQFGVLWPGLPQLPSLPPLPMLTSSRGVCIPKPSIEPDFKAARSR